MRIVGNNPELSRQIMVTADGAISAAGKPLVVNTDGTVSFGEGTTFTQSLGSEVVWESNNQSYGYNNSATFDSNSNRIVIAYTDSNNSYHGTAVVYANAVSVAPNSFLVAIDKNAGMYLEEDTSIGVTASVANDLTYTVTYEELS